MTKMKVDLEDILPSPYQLRVDSGEVDAEFIQLKASIAANGGFLQLPRVRLQPPGKFEIVYGHRRLQAARELGWTTVEVEVVEISDNAAALALVDENMGRKNLNDFEKGRVFKMLQEKFGLSQDAIAKRYGVGQPMVSRYISLAKFEDTVMPHGINPASEAEVKQIEGKITEGHFRVISKAPPNMQADLARKVVQENLSVKDLEVEVKRIRGEQSEAKNKAATAETKVSHTPTPDNAICPSCGSNRYTVKTVKCNGCGTERPMDK
ncbi:MAG: ParB/RepB/Spo0J family partition protein [Thaumarchaeota archaeon]|nr:ParB/RepB/Spo0J family partition protein [Nitrososphaerota archaeon]